MKLPIVAALALLPALAFAESTHPQPTPAEMQRHMRTERALHVADALELDATQALQLDSAMAEFDTRREALCTQIHALHDTLNSTDVKAEQVDTQVQQLFDLEAQMRQLGQEMFRSVSKNLTAPQRAKLALFVLHPGPQHGPEMRPPDAQ